MHFSCNTVVGTFFILTIDIVVGRNQHAFYRGHTASEQDRDYPDDHYTFIALIDIVFTDGTKRTCTGAIIHDNVVITVAHCFVIENDENIESELTASFVVIGTKKMFDTGYEQYLPIERIVFHPDYKSWVADIALVYTFAGMMSDKPGRVVRLAGEEPYVDINISVFSWGECQDEDMSTYNSKEKHSPLRKGKIKKNNSNKKYSPLRNGKTKKKRYHTRRNKKIPIYYTQPIWDYEKRARDRENKKASEDFTYPNDTTTPGTNKKRKHHSRHTAMLYPQKMVNYKKPTQKAKKQEFAKAYTNYNANNMRGKKKKHRHRQSRKKSTYTQPKWNYKYRAHKPNYEQATSHRYTTQMEYKKYNHKYGAISSTPTIQNFKTSVLDYEDEKTSQGFTDAYDFNLPEENKKYNHEYGAISSTWGIKIFKRSILDYEDEKTSQGFIDAYDLNLPEENKNNPIYKENYKNTTESDENDSLPSKGNWRRRMGSEQNKLIVEGFGILRSSACRKLLEKSSPFRFEREIYNEFICYSSDDFFITEADSGAPAMLYGQLVALTVAGVECEGDHVAIGIKLACFCSWIDENLPGKQRNLQCCTDCCNKKTSIDKNEMRFRRRLSKTPRIL